MKQVTDLQSANVFTQNVYMCEILCNLPYIYGSVQVYLRARLRLQLMDGVE